jgi:two-component system, chemotaxis family, CheB/CheR fusion protein
MAVTAAQPFDVLLDYLKRTRGFDFTGYKRASLERRVRHRMDAVQVHSFEEYHDYLQVHPEEFTALFNTILINVTSFFRDPEAWSYLSEHLVPELLRQREGQPLRGWSAGCASGEEAYTLAMVFAEHLGIDEFRDRVKIYATDVDEEALTHARLASYTERELAAVPEELRERYFEPSGGRIVFRKELRRSVIFGRNDIVQDAPISHVDVLTCRNTLMYLNAETQAQVLNRLHFALRPDGVLFLGKAEMLLSHSSLFRAIELKRRFFCKVNVETRDRRSGFAAPGSPTEQDADFDISRLRRASLMQTPAAQISLDSEGRMAIFNNRAIQLFQLSPRDVGRPFQDLEMSYRPIELRTHVDEALAQRRTMWVRDVSLLRGAGEKLSLDVQFIPLSDESGTPIGVTVIFNDVTQHRQLESDLQYANLQLETAYEELQSTNEELETTNEELQSTVEELETTNEELQSTNEELETMNEELQSMNDELQFTNEALRDRHGEIERLNRFMTAVLGSMSSGVAVVDADMLILAWNRRAEDLWGVRTDEAVGEHLMNLDIGLPLEQLRQPIRSQFAASDPESATLALDAVNRRGKALQVQVTLTHIRDHGAAAPAAMLVMDVVEPSA